MTVFRINEPDVVHEVFDDEIIVVNLDSGAYYSLTGTGRTIWIDLIDGFATDEVARRIASHYTGEFSVMAGAVADFARRLGEEKLLVPAAEASARNGTSATEPASHKTVFQPPSIEKYEDMQDLLALDPIHEADSTGWPVARKVLR